MTELYSRATFAPFTIEGEFHDGQTSKSVPAQLLVNNRGARLVADQLEIEISPADLLLSDRIGNTPRRIEWHNDGAFVTQDNAGTDRLHRLLPGGKVGRLAFGLESNLPFAIVALVSVALLLGSVMFWGIPTGARYLATQIPQSLAERAGNEVMAALDQIHLEPSTLSSERAEELRTYLASHDPFPPVISFRSAGETIGPNAFALPGGFVVITDELIALAENDEQILAVYLHETGHARALHSETSVLTNSAWLVLLTLITGDINGMTETIFAVPVMLGNLAFSRELEREADDHAITELKALGLDPSLLADMLQRMTQGVPDTDTDMASEEASSSGEGDGLLDYLSTHPSTAERLKRIRAAAHERP